MLYLPALHHDASPQAISERTSYLRVRLAFHPYPQVLRYFCNSSQCGLPVRVTALSPCSWVAHPVSCLMDAMHALFRLAFAVPSTVPVSSYHTHELAGSCSKRHAVRPRSAERVLRPVVSTQFQILFHSPRRGSFHLSLTVLLRYRSSRVFSVGRRTSRFPTGLACPVVLRILTPPSALRLRDSHPFS